MVPIRRPPWSKTGTGNVILDLAGHYLAGPTTNPATTLYGIYASERGQVTIQNGTVAYCYVGVSLTGNGSPPPTTTSASRTWSSAAATTRAWTWKT